VAEVGTIEAAIASKADVLVVVMTGGAPRELGEATLEALKKRKTIGIGYGAAELFGQMGLEIKGGACAHGTSRPVRMSIMKSVWLGDAKAGPIAVLRQTPNGEADVSGHDIFAMYIPPRSELSSVVDVIARWTGDPNYAPIVRQGNCIMVGLPVPATMWAPAYADFFRNLSTALAERKLDAFSTARWEVTKPGTHEFKLAEGRSTDELSYKAFYFQFSEATSFTARLEHRGSKAVMLLFTGGNEAHSTRKDGGTGETLGIACDISQTDVQEAAQRYWILRVTNFDTNAPVDCKLTITCEKR
jgi:hypothetical protein